MKIYSRSKLITNRIHCMKDMSMMNHEVKAFFDEDGTLTASISTPQEVYNIEPAWRHNTLFETEAKMIAYRNSDIIKEDDLGVSHCSFASENKPGSSDINGDRQKRHVPSPLIPTPQDGTKTCRLLLVADYRFFREMGQGSLSRTTNYLIGLIVRIDSLFRKTDFSNGFYGMGFEIKEIRIHQNPTPVSPGRVHYNTEKHNWNTRELLEAFSMAPQHSEFCLSHLFTALSFSNGMLGGSYIASSVITNPGGICSSAYYKNGHQLFLNTAFSSSLNQYGRRLLTSEADLVTTHGFGHNWGSEHDPDTSECSPSTKDGGKHIMYTYSVSGYEPNNKLFSPCSRRSIGAVLLTKSKSCFSEKSSGFCGNLVIEEGEECDVGFGLQNDPCCSVDCKLRPGAQCSDLNHNCCEGCQVASNRKICYEGNNELCAEEGYCSGASSICPDPPHIADGTACYNRGKCLSGQCLPMCESHGMVSCICDSKGEIKDELTEEQDHSCQYCCKETLDSPCEPFTGEDGTFINLDDAFPCERGLCYQGECQHSHSAQDQAERLWDIDEKLPTTTMSNENATDSETEVKSCAIRSQPFYEQLGLRAPLLLLFTQVLQFVDILLLSK